MFRSTFLKLVRLVGLHNRNSAVNRSWAQNPHQIQSVRGVSYYDSEFEGPKGLYTDAEKSYTEWKWVEMLIAPKTVPPAPTDPKLQFSSGWTAPSSAVYVNSPYAVRRTKNHMIPVYCMIKDRGQIRETRIKHIEGNIWELEKSIGRYLKELYPGKVILTYTHECGRFVGIKGDYSEEVKEWVVQQGF